MKERCWGFSPLKRFWLSRFLGRSIPVWRSSDRIAENVVLYVWGDHPVPDGYVGEIVRVEDGFIRSIGLGAALAPPWSWVFDRRGLHHWDWSETDLETLLREYPVTPDNLFIARRLINLIKEEGLSKYNKNTKRQNKTIEKIASSGILSGRFVVLVIGQVPDDAALRNAQHGPKTNVDLVRAVSLEHPNSFIIYKPHPDVVSGLRQSDTDDEIEEIASFCNLVLDHESLADVLPYVDIVHVINSLSGFEALIAGKRVVCHGAPFYAGWGLTEDKLVFPRRNVRRRMEELAYIALAVYPRYMDPRTGESLTVEEAIRRMCEIKRSAFPYWHVWLGVAKNTIFGFAKKRK